MIDEYLKKWIIKAMEDFKVAKHELSLPEDEIATSAVCFHSQQLVEKLLKAYLISTGVDFERTHDLKFLLDLCIRQNNDFKELEVGSLTS
jgi:HEPN domain-containing protein